MTETEFQTQQREVMRRMAELERASERERDDGLGMNHYCGGRMVHLPIAEQCDKCGGTVL